MNGLELEQPGAGRKLGVQPELADMLVMRNQGRRAAAVRTRHQNGFSACTIEYACADIERSETVAVSGSEVEAPFLRRALV